MFGSNVLDVAIGLSFLYMLLSLICTTASELLEAVLKNRAVFLERGIRELLGAQSAPGFWGRLDHYMRTAVVTRVPYAILSDIFGPLQKFVSYIAVSDPKIDPITQVQKEGLEKQKGFQKSKDDSYAKAEEFVRCLYDHGMINSLYRGSYRASLEENKGKPFALTELPSYIPSENFALAFIATVQNLSQEPTPQLPQNVKDALLAFGNIPVVRTLKGVAAEDAKRIEDGVNQQILALGADVSKYKTEIEDWYNSANDRVSGFYKRHSQGVITLLGIATVVILNVDTCEVVRRLSEDPSLRACLVAAAQERVQKPQTKEEVEASLAAITEQKEQLFVLGLPIGWHFEDKASFESFEGYSPKSQSDASKQWHKDCDVLPLVKNQSPHEVLSELGRNFRKLWQAKTSALDGISGHRGAKSPLEELWEQTLYFCKRLFYASLYHIAGWSVTAIAVTLGAPFWFDILNRFIVIRSTVKPAEKSGTEASKDPAPPKDTKPSNKTK